MTFHRQPHNAGLRPDQRVRKEVVRDETAELVLQGLPLTAIATRQGRSKQAVSYDLKVIEERWRAASLGKIAEVRERQLAKLDLIEAKLWDAWDRSCGMRVTTSNRVRHLPGVAPLSQPIDATEEGDALLDNPFPERVEREESQRQQQQAGDPRFIELILRCMQERAKLLGMYPKDAKEEETNQPVRRVVIYIPQKDGVVEQSNRILDVLPSTATG